MHARLPVQEDRGGEEREGNEWAPRGVASRGRGRGGGRGGERSSWASRSDEPRAPTIRDRIVEDVLYGVFPVLNALKAKRCVRQGSNNHRIS
jgi:hypothetical protein